MTSLAELIIARLTWVSNIFGSVMPALNVNPVAERKSRWGVESIE